MAELETITILRVKTEGAKTVQDLKENVSALKKVLNEAEIGTDKYKEALKLLQVNQNALKDAMYATTASMHQVSKSAQGAGESYNALVHQMAKLKNEFRATEDAAKRMELGAQIKAVNDELKKMDALQGNFQRNVGNYAGSIKEALGQLPSFMSPVKSGLDNINKSMGLLSKNPLLGIITLLFPLITKITDGLKDNKTAIDAINKAMKALEPVFNIVTQAVEKVAGWLSQAVDWLLKFAGENKETFQNFIAGAVGVGNAILQYLLAPIRTTVEAVKGLGNVIKDIFTGNFKQIKEDASTAVDGIKDAFKKGFSFKENFAEGKRIGGEWIEGLMSKKGAAKKAGKDIGKEMAQGVADGIDEMEKEVDAAMQRLIEAEMKAEERRNKQAAVHAKNRLAAIAKEEETKKRYATAYVDDERERAEILYEITQTANQKRLDALNQFREDALGRGDFEAALQFEQEVADLEVEIELTKFERIQELRKHDTENAKAEQDAKVEAIKSAAGIVAGVFGNLADMYEADGEANTKSAKKAKALRIAESTINTISGAVGAYAQAAATIPPPYGIILGAVQAATVMAAGMANIAKMRSVNVDGGGSSTSASVSAPTVNVEPQQTSIVQSQGDEQRLNNMLQDQRVYILDSDIEAKQGERRVQVAESSF